MTNRTSSPAPSTFTADFVRADFGKALAMAIGDASGPHGCARWLRELVGIADARGYGREAKKGRKALAAVA